MAKKVSDKERAIAFFTTAPEAEVMPMLETINTIARARGFAIGRKRKTTTPATPAKRQTRSTAPGKGAGTADAAKVGETAEQSSAAAGSQS